ncbi:hypothetical protein B5C34_02925 [Pacificimonas flava]|uniref:Uncharacterized protein n=2 Tax=Pacificimonas TaxID=1960290 RepID=A0A219B3Y1_9SPHN|nr:MULTISPECIES: hypothetical protein [Pacificimonas]MBZ6377826.1 hypothetical protein [Pacificimonas aurantium]OWV32508.1 hypothetical protein B5C34_02925 [Pacificimonas flava]
MIEDLKTIYRSAWRFSRDCPLLFLIPVFVEMAQHIVELHLGMYASEAGAVAAEQHPFRLALGFAKIVALTLPGYWFVRYMAFGDDPAAARRLERKAVLLWGSLALAGLAISANNLFGTPIAEKLGAAGTEGALVWGILSFLVGALCTVWLVAWALGNSAIGPLRSARVMLPRLPRYVAYFLGGMAPLMALHYGLAILAVTAAPGWLDWVLMILDAAVVGWLALTLRAPDVIISMRAAEETSLDLQPELAGSPAPQLVRGAVAP